MRKISLINTLKKTFKTKNATNKKKNIKQKKNKTISKVKKAKLVAKIKKPKIIFSMSLTGCFP